MLRSKRDQMTHALEAQMIGTRLLFAGKPDAAAGV